MHEGLMGQILTELHRTDWLKRLGQNVKTVASRHPTKQPEDGCQVFGYSHSTRLQEAAAKYTRKRYAVVVPQGQANLLPARGWTEFALTFMQQKRSAPDYEIGSTGPELIHRVTD
ncbi:MAG: hypothetical protein HZC43_01830 [Nitrosomonadales bacterium]|nr:hypothetical protein [Nitrosomonadales bacterium]